VSDTQNASDAKQNDNDTGMSFQEWLNLGVNKGFCTPMYCENHDGFHASDWEVVGSMPDNDYCWPVVRLKGD